MNLILTPLRAEAGIVLTHLRSARPTSRAGVSRCWVGRGPGGTRLAVGCTGWGARRARSRANALAGQFRPERIVAWGVAGALTPTLRAGDLAVCRTIVDGTTGEALKLRANPPPIDFPAPGRRRLARASDLTWRRPVVRRSTRRRLAERFGCTLVEMENAALGRAARDADAAFLPLRTILDDFSCYLFLGVRELRFLRTTLRAGARAAVGAAEC